MEIHQNIQKISRRRRLLSLLLVMLPLLAVGQSREWQLMHKGNQAYKNKAFQTAGSYYSKLLKQDAGNMRALYNLGCTHLSLHEDSTAISQFEQVAARESTPLLRSMANYNKGFIYQRQAGEAADEGEKQQKLQAAIDAYKKALRDVPTSDVARYNMVVCQKQLRKDKENNKNKDKEKKQDPQQQKQQQSPSSQPLINYARQAEQQTRKKINSGARQRGLEKNW